MGVKHRGHTEPAGAPRRRFAGCSAVGRWGMRDGFRFVPAADAPSQTQSIPSAAPAALCVALCCQNAGRGRDGDAFGPAGQSTPKSERIGKKNGQTAAILSLGGGQSLATPVHGADSGGDGVCPRTFNLTSVSLVGGADRISDSTSSILRWTRWYRDSIFLHRSAKRSR